MRTCQAISGTPFQLVRLVLLVLFAGCRAAQHVIGTCVAASAACGWNLNAGQGVTSVQGCGRTT